MSFTGRCGASCFSMLMLACVAKQDENPHDFGDTEGHTCPMEVLDRGDCPAVGETCEHGDFICSCVCGCDSPNPTGPGFWQCDYGRDSLVQLGDASLTLDCEANTVAGAGSLTLDNVDAHAAIDVTLGSYSLSLQADGLPDSGCSVCKPGDECETPPASVEPGAMGSLDWSFDPKTCEQTPQPCDYCGGTASLTMHVGAAGEGLSSWDVHSFEGVSVVCP